MSSLLPGGAMAESASSETFSTRPGESGTGAFCRRDHLEPGGGSDRTDAGRSLRIGFDLDRIISGFGGRLQGDSSLG